MKNATKVILFTLILSGCNSPEEIPESEQPIEPMSEAEQINHWIYDEMNYYYFWREDLPDSSSCDFTTTPKQFYESLLSPKDRFSYFSQSSSRSGDTQDIGFAYQQYRDNVGNSYYEVLYITSHQARIGGLRRGDLVRIDYADANQVSLTVGVWRNSHFCERAKIQYQLQLSRAAINETVQLDSVYHIDGKKIGYLCYLEFGASADFAPSFNKFEENNIDELIIDLRYNHGGLLNTCQRLCNLIVHESAYGHMFQQLSYNDVLSKKYLEETGDERTYTFYEEPETQLGTTLGPKWSYLNMTRVFVLTSNNSASASEATINSLSPYIDVITIGETTVGKGVGMFTITSPKYKYALVPITFRYYNSLGVTVPDEGLEPDYYVPDGYSTSKKDLGDISEPLLAKALEVIFSTVADESGDNPTSTNDAPEGLEAVGEPSFVTEFQSRFQGDGVETMRE